MSQNAVQWVNAPILYLDTIDSTNNYAMQLIDADKAQHGTTVLTRSQTNGKGQRGKRWEDKPGESLLMSLITVPPYHLEQQFIFSASIAVLITEVLQSLGLTSDISIKWPNDIIINDKKAGGILIENILRGNRWSYAVIGLGINVLQEAFDKELKTATSLKIETGNSWDPAQIMHLVRQAILERMDEPFTPEKVMDEYNSRLYQRHNWQAFQQEGREVCYVIRRVLPNGQLEVAEENGDLLYFNHGELVWIWEKI